MAFKNSKNRSKIACEHGGFLQSRSHTHTHTHTHTYTHTHTHTHTTIDCLYYAAMDVISKRKIYILKVSEIIN